jgi:hypothetical protein
MLCSDHLAKRISATSISIWKSGIINSIVSRRLYGGKQLADVPRISPQFAYIVLTRLYAEQSVSIAPKIKINNINGKNWRARKDSNL